jgi:quinone-modifying oxidoreductase subunit QmoA
MTMATVETIEGSPGNFTVVLRIKPRFVNSKCTACGECSEVCPVDRSNEFNYGLDKTKAIYLPHDMAFPMRYVIDPQTCLGKECAKCVSVCPFGALDLDMEEETCTLEAAALVWATGWRPFDASSIDYYGFGKIPDVINNVMMERLAAANGPTGGKIVRPSDGKEVRSVAFVQCAGSRDESYLPYCSGVCCLASLKQALYVREQYPDAQVSIYYIDVRALGRMEEFYNRVKADDKVSLVKGKVADIRVDRQSKDLILGVEDVHQGKGIEPRADLVVLATGMVPSTAEDRIPGESAYDGYGFVVESSSSRGIIPAGCVKRPVDVAHSVQDATGAALMAIQTLVRR